MNRPAALCLTAALCTPFANVPAWAQWPDDAAANHAIADRTVDQVIPLIGVAPDGSSYIGWFDGAAGGFEVHLQRLDAEGVEQWPHNGMLISDHPQNSALFGWDLIADSAGNCVLVFSDERDGGDLDIHAYKIGPGGAFLWGPDGITLSANSDFEPAPRVTETSNGDFVFVWGRDDATGDGDIRMQRVAADGTVLLAAGGIPAISSAGEDPGFPIIAASAGGDVILAYLRDISSFPSPRHIRAARFNSLGVMVWGPIAVFDAVSVPIGYFPTIRADGTGGAVIAWHRSQANFFNSFVQRLDAGGVEQFPHNGVSVSTVATMHHIDPAIAFSPVTGNTVVFWNERNSNQSQWGIFTQKITSAGTRAWGSAGVQLLAVNNTFKSGPRAVPTPDGAITVLTEDTGGGNDRVIAMRVDESGTSVWPGSTVVVSSAVSGKSRLPVAPQAGGGAIAIWEDDRDGPIDVYGQNLNLDGTLGASGPSADVDGDGDVDAIDVARFSFCMNGPVSTTPPVGCSVSIFTASDLSGDGDVDLEDAGLFAQVSPTRSMERISAAQPSPPAGVLSPSVEVDALQAPR